MARGPLRLPLALVAAVVVAEAAVLLLRPRGGVIDPAPVRARSYFSPAYLERARDFRRPQLALFGGQLLIEAALLVYLVRRPPRRLGGSFRHPLLAGAAVGAGLSVALTLATLPLGAVARQRAKDVGLVTQSWGGWAGDVAKSTAIGGVLAGGGAALLLGGMRARQPAAVVGIGAVAHDVAQAPDLARGAALDVAEHRLDRLAIPVDVGDDGEPHEGSLSRRRDPTRRARTRVKRRRARRPARAGS